jgi:hypothetical protein
VANASHITTLPGSGGESREGVAFPSHHSHHRLSVFILAL